MSVTATEDPQRTTPPGDTPVQAAERRPTPTWVVLAGILVVWIALWAFLKGNQTLYLPGSGRTGFHDWFTDLKSDLISSRDTNVLMQVTGAISDVFTSIVEWLQGLISEPALPRPVPEIGWLGVVGIAGWVVLAIAGWRLAVATVLGLLAMGYLGYWSDSMDTLIITFFSVGIALLIGFPLAVWMGNSKRATAAITPVLDVLQTMPTYVYLVPLVLFFAIGASAAVAATVLYAVPPVVRIAGHGIRNVSATAIEATDSLGQSGWQRLTKVQLPMAKRTIIVGVNQTIMAALSMVVIAGAVNGPGLGKPVIQALQSGRVGTAFVSGLCIVIIAILLDRTTTVASERSELVARGGGGDPRTRRILLAVTGVAAVVMVYLSRRQVSLAEFPESTLGTDVADKVQELSDWITGEFSVFTTGLQENTTTLFINPLQELLTGSPWWLTAVAVVAISFALAGERSLPMTVFCLAGLYVTDLWYDSMVTLTSVLFGTAVVMVLAVVVGVWMARSTTAERAIRPVLDAAQTMPPFVYLIPAVGLFGPTRFTAIVAGVVYATPIAVKLVADGVKAVSPTTVEAATAAGSSSWQIITKVQLPMAKQSLVLAVNQGLLYVLSVVVIGGLVGGGALGYDVALGISRTEYFGKGVAAGAAIVLLGIMVDRIANRAAIRQREDESAVLRNTLRRYPRW